MSDALVKPSLVEQILDDMFSKIEGHEEFDAQTIERLKHLAAGGDLHKPIEVAKAITFSLGQGHEAAGT
jgi:hypothetical protein